MKALVCRGHGLPDRLQLVNDWPEPAVGEHEVLVRVRAAGLNFPDVLVIQGKYQFQPELPFVPGSECSGEVEAVGSAVTRFRPGDSVIVAAGTGAFCAKVAAREETVIPMPQGLSFEQAAGVSITYFTSWYALKQRARLQSGETLLVLGAAGVIGRRARGKVIMTL
jgi:NADPH2:quinone reductase